MSDTAANATPPKHRLRWFQFSLRTLLVFVLVCGLVFGCIGSKVMRVRSQRGAVAEIERIGGRIVYDYQAPNRGASQPPGPRWLRGVLGDDIFASVIAVSFDDVDRWSDDRLALVERLPELQEISLSGPRVDDTTVGRLCALSKLRGLALVNTSVTGDGLLQLAQQTDLLYLTLHGPNVNDSMIRHLDKFENLVSLQLIKSNVTDKGMSPLSGLRHLQYLDFFEAPGIRGDALRGVKDLDNLVQLSLVGTSIRRSGLEHLANLRHLEFLNLAGSPVTDDNVRFLRGHNSLRSINVCGTGISDVAVEYLITLPNLDKLDASRTGLTDAGLSKMTKMHKLERLHLCFCNRVTDAGLSPLRGMTSLKYLELGPTVTVAGCVDLKKSFPQCEIHHVAGGGLVDWP